MKDKGIQVAQVLSDFANSSLSQERENFVDMVTTEHRYLQQEMFKMMLSCIDKWSFADITGMFDSKNEYTVKASKVMIEALKREGLY